MSETAGLTSAKTKLMRRTSEFLMCKTCQTYVKYSNGQIHMTTVVITTSEMHHARIEGY
jgi:hypothetical protein